MFSDRVPLPLADGTYSVILELVGREQCVDSSVPVQMGGRQQLAYALEPANGYSAVHTCKMHNLTVGLE